jgi:type I restriction enzyme S subunit
MNSKPLLKQSACITNKDIANKHNIQFGWAFRKLGDVVYYVTDKINVATLALNDYVSTDNMLPNCGGIITNSNIINNAKATKYAPKDILISNIRPYFKKIWLANKNGGCSNDVLVIRNKYSDLFCCQFFYYYLTMDNFFDYVMAGSKGTKMPRGDKSHILKYPMLIPPLSTQKQIASILSTLDEKIDINHQINKKLEEIAQTLFKQWFVDFNFPDKNGNPYKDSGGAMIDSELGLIPKDWNVGKITNIITRENVSYKCNKKDVYDNGNTPILDQGKNGLYGFTNRTPDFIASYENPVIVFTNHTCNFWFIDYSFCAIQNILPFRGKDGYDEHFIYYLTKDSIQFSEYKGHWLDFVAKNFIIPPTIVANKFSQIAKIMLNKISQRNKEIKTLQQTRNSLLPKLMSGEINVNINRHCEEQSDVAISLE